MLNSDQKRAFVAVILSGIVLFSWQYFMGPVPTKDTPAVPATKTSVIEVNANTTPNPASAISPALISQFSLQGKNSNYQFNSDLSLSDASNSNALFNLPKLSGSHQTFKLQLLTDRGPVDIVLNEISKTVDHFIGENKTLGISFNADVLENGKLHFNLVSQNPSRFRLSFNGVDEKLDNGQIRQFITFDKDVSFLKLSKEKDVDGNFHWLGIDYNYHMLAFILKDKEPARIHTSDKGILTFETVNPKTNFEGHLIFTKKNYDHLLSLGDNLHLSVDFGFFAVLAVPMLRGLQFIYKFIPNYGIAIILLTIFLRLITFPLQYKSFKSMKKMQLIQPELQKIKEKYKDDSQKMQKETMALFQKSGANPLSGCLPLLLQMPFFFAIYRVLYSAVELVGAPFFGWIHDLSIHDPFYVLPVLMALSMFFQNKLNPQTSADPTQQKVMMLMPLIFGFIMKNLPAGLVLYIFISTAFGMALQYMVYKTAD